MFINGTIREYVDKASAATPTPGGGSVSALAGALGVAMACMAANFTVGKKKFKNVENQVRDVLQRLEAARESLLELTEEDSRAYGRLAAALAMPKGTEEENAAREAGVQRAIQDAMGVPLRVVRTCRDVLEQLTELVHVANPNLISDVGVAAVLTEAALRGAGLNVEVNLAYLKDKAQAADVRKELDAAQNQTAAALRGVSEKVAKTIGTA